MASRVPSRCSTRRFLLQCRPSDGSSSSCHRGNRQVHLNLIFIVVRLHLHVAVNNDGAHFNCGLFFFAELKIKSLLSDLTFRLIL